MQCKFCYVLLFVVWGLSACQSSPEEAILGKWEIDKNAVQKMYDEKIAEIRKSNRSKMKNIRESIAQVEKIQISYIFKPDGTLTMLSQGAESKGKWLISSDGKTLQTIDENNHKSSIDIEEISKDKMILKVSTSKENVITLIFRKVES